MEFPLFKTKIEGLNRRFNLNDPAERKEYFELKVGSEIKKLREYLKNNTFVAYLLGKKNSGKGTYAKLFMEVVDNQNVVHFSVGDAVRAAEKEYKDPKTRDGLINFLEKNYRGFLSLENILKSLESRSTKTLLPTEFILALVKREIAKFGRKAIFIDGFPRDMDQVSYSLFFRDLINYRDDLDFFILIDLPESVIDARIKSRVVCPICQTPRNIKTLPTKNIGYDKKTGRFFLICDNPFCHQARMVAKEGDELGIEPIRERLSKDAKIIEQAVSLYGVPKIFLRNSMPVDLADQYVDEYEITPEYLYQWDETNQKVIIQEKPWTFLDDNGVRSYSLLPPPVVVALIKQLVQILNL